MESATNSNTTLVCESVEPVALELQGLTKIHHMQIDTCV